MNIQTLSDFLTRKGFRKYNDNLIFEKKIRDVHKRYIIKDNDVFLEQKLIKENDDKFKLLCYGDIRNIFVNNNDRLEGFNIKI